MTGNTFRIVLEAAFWGAAGLIVYAYAGYPLWIYLRSRLHPRPWRQAPIEPSVSIILAVHNGAAFLRQKIDHLLSLDYPQDRTEILVVSDGSTDSTNEILQQFRHQRVRSIICGEHRGKAAAVNEGIRRASGEILIFTDVRQQFEASAVRNLVSNFADPAIGCVTGELSLQSGSDPVTSAIGGLYWRYEQWIRTCEARADSVLGVSGAFYAIRRQGATVLPAGLILDDMYQPLSVARRGYRAVLDQRARFVDSLPPNPANEFQRKVRTLAGNFQLLQLAPWLLTRANRLRFNLILHKLLRLVVPLLLLTTLATSALLARHSLLYEAAFIAQIGMYVLAALGQRPGLPLVSRIGGAANAFCLLNSAVVVAFYRFLFTRGPLWKIWTTRPAPSAPTERNRALVPTVE